MIARLMVADSEQNADMLYAVGMFVPDPFIYFEAGGRSHVVMSDLEVDRARQQAKVDRVLPYRRYCRQLERAGHPAPRLADVLNLVLREHRIRQVVVPGSFPVGLAKKLRVKWRVADGAFFPERECKTAAEVRRIVAALELAETGMNAAVAALRRSRVGRNRYLYWRGERLTSAHVRGLINATIAARGGCAQHTIVAGGNQGCDPHERGHGPLRAHEPIILDIFPRDTRTGYWGDITRTVVRGRASEKVKQLYALVAQAQDVALERLRAGVDGRTIHAAIHKLFRREGFPTGVKRGFQQGFFHGTGHGLGLEIHEAPRISVGKSILAAGHVVTVEPGLYYRGLGGVRLEDVAVITATGCRNLTTFPRFLEI